MDSLMACLHVEVVEVDEEDYAFVQHCRPLDTRDMCLVQRCSELQAQIRELQASHMRWEIQRMVLEMELITERSNRHLEISKIEDQLHHERQNVTVYEEQIERQRNIIAELRAQMLFHTRHKRMAFLKKELREKYLSFRLKRSYAQVSRCNGKGLLELLKREIPTIDSSCDDAFVYI